MMQPENRLEYSDLRNLSVVDSVLNWITDQIIKGNLRPGDKLPTEAELCQNLGAGRNSVREAIKKLEAYGVVYIKRAEGTFVSDRYNQKMLDPMLYSIILQNKGWSDFIDLRRTIDIGTLYVVVRKQKSRKELESVHEALEELEQAVLDKNSSVDEITGADCQFHTAITALSKNPQLVTLAEYINRITVPSRKETTKAVIESGKIERYMHLHKQWLDIIENSDLSHIGQAVVDHYVFWERHNAKQL